MLQLQGAGNSSMPYVRQYQSYDREHGGESKHSNHASADDTLPSLNCTEYARTSASRLGLAPTIMRGCIFARGAGGIDLLCFDRHVSFLKKLSSHGSNLLGIKDLISRSPPLW
jgi:hypothetical protein